MAFNTKVDVADTELEANEAVADAGDVTLEDEALVEAESDADETTRRWTTRKRTSPRTR